MKIIVIGLGNPILGDDGVGWRVAEKVKCHLFSSPSPPPLTDPVDVECLSLGGISLMEHMIGYDRVILIDSFTGDAHPGSIRVARLDEIPNYSSFHITSAHDTSLQNAMKLGRDLGVLLPMDVTVVGISTLPVFDLSEELSPPVAEAVPKAAQIVIEFVIQKITIH
jgi:hydrogenase maturation protease